MYHMLMSVPNGVLTMHNCKDLIIELLNMCKPYLIYRYVLKSPLTAAWVLGELS